MKIFYAVQATGNGHISRAMELIPHLEQFGTVDVFLSGHNSQLSFDLPIKYRSRGLSLFYTSTGGLNYWKILKSINPSRIRKESSDLPVEKYDLVINDFEYITSVACAKKGIPSVQLGHQASFQSSHVPRPDRKSLVGEWTLKYYCSATHHIGLHFERYDDNIFYPIIKKEILKAEPSDKNYYTVYLPSYSLEPLTKLFSPFKDSRFHIFSNESGLHGSAQNIRVFPVNRGLFNQSLVNCTGIITGAGFETPAEALYLGKKLLSIPTRGHYEQQCNAAALKKMGVTCLETIDNNFQQHFTQWRALKTLPRYNYQNSIPTVLKYMFESLPAVRTRHITDFEQGMTKDPVILACT